MTPNVVVSSKTASLCVDKYTIVCTCVLTLMIKKQKVNILSVCFQEMNVGQLCCYALVLPGLDLSAAEFIPCLISSV